MRIKIQEQDVVARCSTEFMICHELLAEYKNQPSHKNTDASIVTNSDGKATSCLD